MRVPWIFPKRADNEPARPTHAVLIRRPRFFPLAECRTIANSPGEVYFSRNANAYLYSEGETEELPTAPSLEICRN